MRLRLLGSMTASSAVFSRGAPISPALPLSLAHSNPNTGGRMRLTPWQHLVAALLIVLPCLLAMLRVTSCGGGEVYAAVLAVQVVPSASTWTLRSVRVM